MPRLEGHLYRFIYLFIFVSMLITGFSVKATETPQVKKRIAPMTLQGAKTITAVDVIDLIEKMPELIIIDSRMDDRPQGYIESSINLSDLDTDCDSLAEILKNTHTPVVFYCNGVKCRRSEKAIKVAVACGYDHVFWYRGGFDDWMKQGFPFISN